jgi:AmmeMemoRadiSam system protein B/AmmeMemoRadiSam system protein A
MAAVHISPFSGTWYPARPADLRRLLEELFTGSTGRIGPDLLPSPAGFVTPHAGLMYSGAVAAAAYRHLRTRPPARIVLLGFAHRGGPPAVALPDIREFATPLGRVSVDRAVVEQLAACQPFCLVPESRLCDHSVEIQLPLLQYAAPGVPVVPLYVGLLAETARRQAAEALASLAAEGAVLFASSDFTHYGAEFGYLPFPPDRSARNRLRDLDFGAIDAASSLDPQLFYDYLDRTGTTVCGAEPIALCLSALRLLAGEEIFQTVLDYQTSGEILDDYRHSVSYAALGYFPASSFELSAEDCGLLLTSARATLARLRQTGERVPVPPEPVTPALTRKAAVFVSLHQDKNLLGCVGTHAPVQTLADGVPEMTLAAALDDPRFSGTLEVPGDIEIEISVLSPMKPLGDPTEFCLHRHGAWLRHGTHAALLLPQVASRRNWTTSQFLEALARKAGIPPQAVHQPDSHFSVFQAQVFK